LPDLLAQTRQVIAVEQQGHGRTADIDRPMSVQAMAEFQTRHTSFWVECAVARPSALQV
jgi:hypothetical protein